MERQPRTIADYDALFGPMRQRRAEQEDGRQPGDPRAAGRVMLDLIAADNPPAHLLLGTDAVDWARDHYAARAREIDIWAALSTSTDFQ
jgi:hypothetical protein